MVYLSATTKEILEAFDCSDSSKNNGKYANYRGGDFARIHDLVDGEH